MWGVTYSRARQPQVDAGLGQRGLNATAAQPGEDVCGPQGGGMRHSHGRRDVWPFRVVGDCNCYGHLPVSLTACLHVRVPHTASVGSNVTFRENLVPYRDRRR